MPKDCSECEYQEGCEKCFGGLGCKYWKEIEEIRNRDRKRKKEKSTC